MTRGGTTVAKSPAESVNTITTTAMTPWGSAAEIDNGCSAAKAKDLSGDQGSVTWVRKAASGAV